MQESPVALYKGVLSGVTGIRPKGLKGECGVRIKAER